MQEGTIALFQGNSLWSNHNNPVSACSARWHYTNTKCNNAQTKLKAKSEPNNGTATHRH